MVSNGLNNQGRTIKFTPDAFLLLEESTIFVESSVQKSKLYDKFKKDITKCLSLRSKNLNKIILSYTGKLKNEFLYNKNRNNYSVNEFMNNLNDYIN